MMADVPCWMFLLKASISTDANLRIYTSISPTSTDWQLTHSISVPSLITTTSSNGDDNPSGSGGAPGGPQNPTSQAQQNSQSPATSGSVSGGSGFQQSINGSMGGGPGASGSGSAGGSGMGLINPGKGNEALGGWTVSWCKEKWWGSILAVSSGHSGIIKVSCVRPRG